MFDIHRLGLLKYILCPIVKRDEGISHLSHEQNNVKNLTSRRIYRVYKHHVSVILLP